MAPETGATAQARRARGRAAPGYLGGLPGGGSRARPGRLTPAAAAGARTGAGPPRSLSGEGRRRGRLGIGQRVVIDSGAAPPSPRRPLLLRLGSGSGLRGYLCWEPSEAEQPHGTVRPSVVASEASRVGRCPSPHPSSGRSRALWLLWVFVLLLPCRSLLAPEASFRLHSVPGQLPGRADLPRGFALCADTGVVMPDPHNYPLIKDDGPGNLNPSLNSICFIREPLAELDLGSTEGSSQIMAFWLLLLNMGWNRHLLGH
ncbi:uncharacterized protein LOC115067076 [Nannospalax galili]|uniref:uncharacterized protein LOC115067076 n=1 Tax=Nannospalax galili TaxID=1026970 RepID=UPI00111C257E|nr:uncharacterized protein LOC115067076 [Nannospalax galili]